MSNTEVETAHVRRYVAALEHLRNHPSSDVRVFANEILASLLEVSVLEILTPIVTLPLAQLTPQERLLRLTVEALARSSNEPS